MIDTHAHLHTEAFDPDRPEALGRAFAAGLQAIVEVNIDAAGWPRVVEVAQGDPRIVVTVGIHPHDTGRATFEQLEEMSRHLGSPRVCAVGETGLDFYRDYAPHEQQRAFFRRQVALARESGLPLVVHARTGRDGPPVHTEIFHILEEEGRGTVRGVLHCFSGDLETARRAAGIGFLLGIGGSFTYDRKRTDPLLRSICEELGPELFLLETDCPWLSPHPRRGRRNEPANIPLIAVVLASAVSRPLEEIERLTDAAARKLFRLDPGPGS